MDYLEGDVIKYVNVNALIRQEYRVTKSINLFNYSLIISTVVDQLKGSD